MVLQAAMMTLPLLRRQLSTAARAATVSAQEISLTGTVPYHAGYLFLHAKQSPTSFPKKIESPLLQRLKASTNRWQKPCLVNMRYYAGECASTSPSGAHDGEEEYQATLHIGQMETHHFAISDSRMNNNLQFIQERIESAHNPLPSDTIADDIRRLYLYVCTHAAVDCRCGEHGPKVIAALKEEVLRLQNSGGLKDRYWQDVCVMETGHVGGHK